ncbi:collagen-like protein [Porphyromonas cangingivalis]|uniref:collagen-like protein n=1 Tax=Porphyromonas cangingivalis TaxID=36874 RepID=UPI00068EFCBE|nr:collagen-like protein [Porphyromonas cangingivalis]
MATLILSSFGWVACNDIDIVTPPGPRGHSAYEVWVEAVKNGTIVWKEATDLPNYFKYIKGEKGDAGTDAYTIWVQWIKDGSVDNPKVSGKKWDPARSSKQDFYYFLTGAKGEDGRTPFVNEKGNWQIGDKDTGIPAKGAKGDKGDKGDTGAKGEKGDAGEKGDKGDTGAKGDKGDAGEKGDKGDTGAKGDKGDAGAKGDKGDAGAKGDKGDAGAKGDKGDTGAKGDKGDAGAKGDKGDAGAKGDKGDTGEKGNQGNGDRVEIKEGFWYINGVNTNVRAEGQKGEPGVGKSAYQLWVEEVNAGTIRDKDGRVWKKNKTELSDFWEYLKGKDGKNAGGGSSTPMEKTKFEILDVQMIPEEPSADGRNNIGKLHIKIKTEASATIYYQSSGRGNDNYVDQLKIYSEAVGNSEEVVLKVEVLSYDQMLHIWSEAPGKIPSHQHHLSLYAYMPM